MPERTVAQMLSGKSENNLFPEYQATDTDSRRTAIDDTSFSPEVKAKVRGWHIRSDNLLADLDAMLALRRRAIDPGIEEAERLCNEARAILASLRLALEEVLDGLDPIGVAVQRVKERLPPLAPAAADAVCDLTDTEISAVRALNRSPPQVVRVVVCVCCSLIKLARPGIVPAETSPQPLASWDDAQALLARPDFAKALKGYDPKVLHRHPLTAKSLRSQLANLSSGGSGSGGATSARQRLQRARASATAGGIVVHQVTTFNAAVRGGGKAVGSLYLWCARVLAAAEDLLEEQRLQEAQEAESGGLASVLEHAQAELERVEQRAAAALGSG